MPARSKSAKQPRTAESILAEKAAAAAAAAPVVAKSAKPAKVVAETVPDNDESESESASESASGSEGSVDSDDFGGLLDGVELDNVMSNYFMYQHDDGTVLNITDAILLTKESIDRQTECMEKLRELLESKLK